MSPHLSSSNLKCQHLWKATAGAYFCPCPLMQYDPCQIPQNKAAGCPPAGAAPLTLSPSRPSGCTVSPLGLARVSQSLPRRGVGSEGFSSQDRYSCRCSSIIPQSHTLHQPLALQYPSPSGCSGLVHAGSTWSLCCPIAILVLLSRKEAFHKHTWSARSTVLPKQGQETNPPCWEELSRRLSPSLPAEAMQMWYTPLD